MGECGQSRGMIVAVVTAFSIELSYHTYIE